MEGRVGASMEESLTELEALLRLTVAAVLSGLIGFDREVRSKAAGIRTHMLVGLGAALFMISGLLLVEMFEGEDASTSVVRVEATRVAAGIITGIGFLGAGQIFRHGTSVQGLTSAAGIWVTAAIGLLVGLGYYVLPIAATALAILIISVLGYVEHRIGRDDSEEVLESDRELVPTRED